MGISFIMMQVKSPMLVCVGMYLPLATTFAIFIGGIIKGIVEYFAERRKYTPAQVTNTENVGVLLASGLIAGEALMGLVIAIFAAKDIFLYDIFKFFTNPPVIISAVILILIAFVLIYYPLKNAGDANAPVPPKAG